MGPDSWRVLCVRSKRSISRGLRAAEIDFLLPRMFLVFIHLACSDFQRVQGALYNLIRSAYLLLQWICRALCFGHLFWLFKWWML